MQFVKNMCFYGVIDKKESQGQLYLIKQRALKTSLFGDDDYQGMVDAINKAVKDYYKQKVSI